VNCIGCGKCVRACPEAFFIEGSKYGRARVLPGVDPLAIEEEVQVAMETCPVDCIHWVSHPLLHCVTRGPVVFGGGGEC
jgi:ferredoxin